MCKISTRSSLAAILLAASILADLAVATPWGNYYEYGGHPSGPQVYQYNQRVEHHRTVPDSVPASSGAINCRCTKLRYCTKILEMLRNPKSSYGNFNSKLKELACGYGIDNEPNICCPLDDSWLRDVGTDDEGHSSEENDSHSAIGWDEGYTNRKSDNGHQWSKERFKYIPMTTQGKDVKRIGNTRTSTTSTNWWKQRPQKSNTIAQFEDPKTMKNCPPEIYPNEAEVTLRPTKAYVAPIMRTTKRPSVVLGSNRLAETTTLPITTEPPLTTTELITTVLPTVVPDQPMINAPLCGLSVNTRIIGGETEVPGQFPWMARLAYRNRTSGRVTYRCAGSLITNRHVITVAHCVTNLIDELQLVSIRLGDLECNAVTDPRCSARYQDFAIDRVLPHESYDMPKYANDIALIKLRETTETYNIISPLCLPTDQYAPYALNLTGQMGIIAGWGSTSNRSNTPSPTLQWLRLPIVDTAGCATAYARYSVNSRNPIIVSENQMCAQGQENRDACQGDSGGPLMNEAISTRDRFVLLGLVSFGPRTCGVSNFPGVYTRISSYIDWILTNVMLIRSIPNESDTFAANMSAFGGRCPAVVPLLLLAILSLTAAQQCTLPDNRSGQCILLRNCNSLLTLIKKKPLLDEDRTYLQRTQCGWSTTEKHPLVCCADGDLVAPVRVGAGLLPTPGQCGIQTSDRIFGGVNTRIDEFPWIALLKYAKPNNVFGFHCGGVLINDRYVLTASHCVNGKDIPTTWSLAEVRLGEWDTSTAQDCEGLGEDVDCSPPPIDVPIESKIPHPEYVPTSTEQYNDIALLRLSATVPYSDFIKPICLPTQAELKARDYVGFRMQVAGWGRTATARYSNVKQKVAVDGVSLDACNQVYQREQVLLRQSQLCAGGEAGKDSCQGDSGGPLTGIHTSGGVQYWYLIGLVSFGPTPCGQAGWPGVYTKVDQYVDWVTATIVA
ncbi:transmembrane protease serine 9-like [Anopheles maculipalpis]|uniref:transmembrane protease serine 9-like n=1 Tax=Anopheles maculipalpis TaxID=1496333 RepID=UPI00215956BA|nr:transmembrane protease serine 9-like [Anopheles maculipalpis]